MVAGGTRLPRGHGVILTPAGTHRVLRMLVVVVVMLVMMTAMTTMTGTLVSAGKMDYPPDKISQVLHARTKKLEPSSKKSHLHTTGPIPGLIKGAPPSPNYNKTDSASGGHSKRNETSLGISTSKNDVDCIEQQMYDSFCSDSDYYEDCDCECDVEEEIPVKQLSHQGPRLSHEVALDQTNQDRKPMLVNGSQYGILFVWPVLASIPVGSTRGKGHVGTGNEFRAAVKSIRKNDPYIQIFLATNIGDCRTSCADKETMSTVNIINMDFMSPPLSVRTRDLSVSDGELFRHLAKPFALVQGWSLALLPEYVLVLDVETIVGRTSEKYGLRSVFEPLKVQTDLTCSVDFGNVIIRSIMILPAVLNLSPLSRALAV
jgi:hypothetical protein